MIDRRGATLLIYEARPQDAGAYSCHVTNVIGSAASAANHVTVAEPSTLYVFVYGVCRNIYQWFVVAVLFCVIF